MKPGRRAFLGLGGSPNAKQATTQTIQTPQPAKSTDAKAGPPGLPPVISWLQNYIDDAGPAPAPVPARTTPRAGAGLVLLRPPGAKPESEFRSRCTSCGDCIAACPHQAIQKAPPRFREAAGTPYIDPLRQPCRLCEDMPCISACEAGALAGEGAKLGQARIDRFACINHHGSECRTCIEHCPVPGAITMKDRTPEVFAGLCVGCGICQHVCPAPENAVMILPNADRGRESRGRHESF